MAKISKNVKSIVLSDSSAIYYRRLRAGSASRVKQPILKKCNIVCKLLKKYTKMLPVKCLLQELLQQKINWLAGRHV